ncbi:hypothetical protein [Mycolicibacterium porcinum]
MFEQHNRWLEELREHIDQKQLVTCKSGHMPLSAIVAEIAEASSDPQPHDGRNKRDWRSLAVDLADARSWIGPEFNQLVDGPVRAIEQAITGDLLMNCTAGLDDSKRPQVAAATASLTAVLGGDDLLVAAWRDLVAACRNIDHTVYPYERIRFLRDTLLDLSEYRKQARGFGSPVGTAVDVLFGSASDVRYARAMVGDPVDATTSYHPCAKSDLTEDELADLAERCIVTGPPPIGEYVVWFRISPAFIPAIDCVRHGDVTFYDAQVLAGSLTDHERARQLDVVPEELLTDEISELQLSGKVDDYRGFQFEPQLVYARVTVRDVERHRAVDVARTYLDTVLAVVGVPDDMWKVLGGHLLFAIGEPPPWIPAEWGRKEQLPEPVFYQNDFVTTRLREMTADGYVITAAAAEELENVLRLEKGLASAPLSDPEAIVMASVRAIEHANTWVTPTPGRSWYDFAVEYFGDGYAVEALANRVVNDVYTAVQLRPDRSPGAATPTELGVIRKDITVHTGYGERIDKLKTPPHVSSLKTIYADHPLARQLAETDQVLADPAVLGTTFDAEKQHVSNRVERLRRTRNAAIHGGVLSETACATIADFAVYLARMALNAAVWAIVTGQPVSAHTTQRRDDYRQQIQRLRQGGDLTNLFNLT